MNMDAVHTLQYKNNFLFLYIFFHSVKIRSYLNQYYVKTLIHYRI